MTDHKAAADAFTELAGIMAKLRDPDGGCPWDLEQDFSTIYPYTLEEAYEVADAIDRGDMHDLKEELGDLLFQVVFHSQMASEDGHFSLADVTRGISEKMIARHPHVFVQSDARSSEDQTHAWEEMKASERAAKHASSTSASALDGVAQALPSLLRAEKLQKRAARVGFDWTDADQIFDKLDEETAELKEAIKSQDTSSIEDELGDLLFVAANLARRLNIDPEMALRNANAKFERRFRAMEALARENGQVFSELTLEAQESYWQAVKQVEAQQG